jgi:hypothetical protein
VVETGGLENRYPANAGSGVRIPLPPPFQLDANQLVLRSEGAMTLSASN